MHSEQQMPAKGNSLRRLPSYCPAQIVTTNQALFDLFAVCPPGIEALLVEELRGLDVGEHGMEAYSGFQIFSTT